MIKTGISHDKIAFLDIETASSYESIFDMPTPMAVAWEHVVENRYKDELSDTVSVGDLYKKYSALYPEFARIVCISIGHFTSPTDIKVKAFYGENGDEKSLINQTMAELTRLSTITNCIGGHNIKNFDIPYIVRRSIVVDTALLTTFDLYSRKPWEITQFVDTMEMWKVLNSNVGSASLESIAAAFGFKSPKEEMSGSRVTELYYSDDPDKFKKIGKYCNGDVLTTLLIYVRMTKGDVFMRTMKVVENSY